jgi:alpha-glucosidase
VAGVRKVADEFGDRLLIGEIYLPPEKLVAYYGKELEGVHLPFNFGLLETRWDARAIAELVDRYEAALPEGSWPNWVLGNHDRPRIATRAGPAQARVAAMLLLTLRGTPTIYYGDEIGMENASVPADRIRDPLGESVPALGRDGARTPMRWEATGFGGFSDAEPWCFTPAGEGLPNVAGQLREPASLLSLHRRLIRARRKNPALAVGTYRPLPATGDVLLFTRQHPHHASALVALNLGGQPAAAILPDRNLRAHIIVSTFCDREGEQVAEIVDLRPNEGLVIELTADSNGDRGTPSAA